MDTKIITNPSEQDIDTLARALRNGELVSIPTETVYGLGANGLDPEAMDKIYAAKGRPSDNPLILHVPNSESIKTFGNRNFCYGASLNGYILARTINDYIA